MVAIACALDRDVEDRLLPSLVGLGHTVVARAGERDDLVALALAVRPSVMVVSASPRRLTRELLSHCDDLGIRIVAIASTQGGRRAASTLGLYEVIEADAPAELLDAMITGGSSAPLAAQTRRRGTVLAVWGPAGAPGRTTIAITIAAELAAAGHPVALIDADTHAASIAPSLGMLDEAPGFAAACRLAAHDSLSLTELDRIQQSYPVRGGELRVLTGITRPSRWPELGTDRVTATLELCRDWAEYVVVDTAASLEHDEEISSDLFAPRRNAATLAVLRGADRIVAVGASDPIGIARYLRGHGDLVEIVEGAPITTVINKVRATVSGLAPSGQVRSTLARFGGIDDVVVVPNDPRATDAALSAGKAIRDVAPRSQSLAAVRNLVTDVILPPAPLPTRRAMRSRSLRVQRAAG